MQLESVWVHGMRRFGGDTPTRLRLDSPLVCLIGANEVGKSTILDALELAHDESTDEDDEWLAVPAAELTRQETIEEDRLLVRLRYRLGAEERELLAGLSSAARLREVRWLEIKKHASGALIRVLEPVPTRDKAARHALGERLAVELKDPDGVLGDRAEGTAVAENTVKGLVDVLRGNSMYVAAGQRSRLQELANFLEEEERSPKLVEEIRAVVESEEEEHPQRRGPRGAARANSPVRAFRAIRP